MSDHILLAEDSPYDEELTLAALAQHKIGNEVVVVRDGQEALDYLFGTGSYSGRDTRRQPNVVLLDISLPRVNGLDVLKHIRADERTQMLPVVMLTSSDEELDRCVAYRCHANSYIRKPVDFDQFSKTVCEVGLYWLMLNLPPPRLAGQERPRSSPPAAADPQ